MKKLFFLCFALALLSGCKKDSSSSPPKEILLSSRIYNGNIISKYYYTTKNQLSRWEYFSEEPGNNVMLFYYTFEYDNNERLQELSNYEMPGDKPNSRIFLEYDNTGKVIAHTYYDLQGADPSEPAQTGSFVYNAKNQLSSFTKRDMDGELSIYINFSYYPNGFLKERNDYDETITNQLRLVGKTIYSVPNTDEAKGWEKLGVIPLDGDEMMRSIRYETIQSYSYSGGVLTWNTSQNMSGREYNANGTMKRQVVTLKRILPAHPDEINNWEYEYIEL